MDSVYAQRREAFLRRLPAGAVALIHGARAQRRNADVEHRFRQTSDLLYLTGSGEPEMFAVFSPGRAQPFVLFVRPRDPAEEVWAGRRLGTEGAVAQLGADAAHPIGELGATLHTFLDGASEFHYLFADDDGVDLLVMAAVRRLRQNERKGMRAPRRIIDLRDSLHELRLRKDARALDLLRHAVAITAEAHVAAMRAARVGAHEFEIEALLDYTFRRRGAVGPGYGTIVGAGNNATVLHYVDNAAPLRAGDLLLVDAGAEFEGFTADVTRTYPVSGRFTAAQRRVYDLVLATQKRGIAMARPGTSIDDIHRATIEQLTTGMVELGLLVGPVDELIEKEIYKKYYMHRTSHWLGLDVHDAGVYYPGKESRPLEPGMVLTVEPGLYIPEDDVAAPPELRGIGVRIEDDVLVTEAGNEVLTREIPKEPSELEELLLAAR